jgi:hypothetical protein
MPCDRSMTHVTEVDRYSGLEKLYSVYRRALLILHYYCPRALAIAHRPSPAESRDIKPCASRSAGCVTDIRHLLRYSGTYLEVVSLMLVAHCEHGSTKQPLSGWQEKLTRIGFHARLGLSVKVVSGVCGGKPVRATTRGCLVSPYSSIDARHLWCGPCVWDDRRRHPSPKPGEAMMTSFSCPLGSSPRN